MNARAGRLPTPPAHGAGFTLPEVVVALAVATALLSALASTFVAARHAAGYVDARALAAERATAIPDLLEGALAHAGHSATPCLVASSVSGDRLALEGGGERRELFAARDGGGRPALYARLVPHPRQPWLEDVVDFRLLAARDLEGVWRTRPYGGAVTAVRIGLTWRDGDAARYDLPLPHAPCLWQLA